MTLFTTPMARQFVGFDSLFDELNKLSDRKEPNYPAYNIAKDDDEHYRIGIVVQQPNRRETDAGGRVASARFDEHIVHR